VWKRMASKLRISRYLITLVFTLLLVACATKLSEPTLTGIPESSLSPASTIQPNTKTAGNIPSKTPLLSPDVSITFTPVLASTATVNLPLPSGKPVSSWKNVPIMPDAIVGEEKEDGYSYTINATPVQVQDFYDTEMPKVGWKFFATGKGETGSLLLMYQKDEKTTTVSIFEQDDVTLVLLIQY